MHVITLYNHIFLIFKNKYISLIFNKKYARVFIFPRHVDFTYTRVVSFETDEPKNILHNICIYSLIVFDPKLVKFVFFTKCQTIKVNMHTHLRLESMDFYKIL